MKVEIRVTNVEGYCAAGYTPGDRFYLNSFLLESEIPICIHAILSLSHVAYALSHGGKLRTANGDEIYLSCPDPGRPFGDGKVIFRLKVVE